MMQRDSVAGYVLPGDSLAVPPPRRPAALGPRWRRLAVCGTLLTVLSASVAAAQGPVYVASGASVIAIDPETAAVQGAIPVGGTVTRVAASADGSRVFAAMAAAGTVAIVDAATRAVVHHVAVGASVTGLAVTPDGATLYASAAGGLLYVVDVASGSVSAPIASGVGDAADLALTADGATLYAASGTVAAIDTATRTVTTTFGLGAVSVEVTPDGATVYVVALTDLFGGGLFVYDATAGHALVASLGLGMPGPMAMAPDGSRVYVSHAASWVDTGYGAGFFPGRSVFVVDGITRTVVGQIDLGASGANWSQQNTPGHLAVSNDRRRLYISVPRLAAVAAADVNTHAVVASTPVAGPGAIAVAGLGPVVPYVVNAVDDTAIYASTGGTAVANVLANDTLGGIRPTLQHVTLTEVSSADGLSLAPGGAVSVAPGTPEGVATLVYEICETAAPANCDQATVTVTVRAPYAIDAVDDAATSVAGRLVLASVLANDTFNGAAATLSAVTLTQVSSTASTVALVPTTGGVFVSVGTAAGPHVLTYRICEKATPANCDTAQVSITVRAFVIDAVNDAGAVTRAGGTAIASVLANDRFNGLAATTATVALTQVSVVEPGISLNTVTGAVTVAGGTPTGTYAVAYRICEKASPANCDEATVTVTVTPNTITAASDYGRGSSKVANTPIASVLTNDRLAGAPATTANVVLSFVSLTPANRKIRLDLNDGSVDVLGKTDSRTFSLVYRICERSDLTNCAQGTATIELSGK